MRHRKTSTKFGKKTPEQNKAILRNLATSLFLHGKLQTTQKRAKIVQSLVDNLIVKSKSDDKMNAIREIKKIIYTVDASRKVFERASKYDDRNSGFTRIVPLGNRLGDAAKLVQIEFIDNLK